MPNLWCLLFIAFIFDFYKVNSCQPPPMGLYNAYSQYSYPSNTQPSYQSQVYSPSYQPPSFTQQQEVPSDNRVLTAPIPPPTLVPSFLQDNTLEDENAFETNVIVPSGGNSSPPSDPPANPFTGDSRQKQGFIEENSSEMTQVLAEKCARTGAGKLVDFLDCTDGVPYTLTSEQAQFGSEKCDFEPEFVCRFFSSSHERIPFKSGQFRINSKTNKLFEETFATLMKRPLRNIPQRSFVYLDIPGRMPDTAIAMLKTDITCQTGDGKLSFDYWSSDSEIVLKVCTTDEKERSCTQDIAYDTEASRIEVDVIHPESRQFAVEIMVSNFTKPSVFIIDNLEFEAQLCESLAFMPETTSLPSTTSNPPRNQAFGSQLRQNFLPLANQGFQPLSSAHFQQLPQYSPLPVVVPPTPGYVTPPPEARYPLATLGTLPPSPAVLNKFRAQQQYRNPLQYPHDQSPLSPGVLFVQNKYSQAPKQMKLVPRLPIQRMTACDMLQCQFDKNICQYKQPETGPNAVRYGKWQISRSPIGNPATGIKPKDHGGFAFVGMDKFSAAKKVHGRTMYILESPTITLDSDTLLSFDLYRRSGAITLQVCLDSLTNCPYEAPKINTKIYWREGESILLPKGTKKIYFVATQWQRFKWLAIDNIVLNKGRGCAGMLASRNAQG